MKLLLLVLLLCCSACGVFPPVTDGPAMSGGREEGNRSYRGNGPVRVETINSGNDREWQTFEKPPERVIAVWQNSVETLLALGVGDAMVAGVGIPDREILLPEYRDGYDRIPHRGLRIMDMETAMMMEPDFILAWYSTFGPKVLGGTDFWHSRGVHTYIAASSAFDMARHTLYNEYRFIWDMGRIFDRRERALDLIREMREEIDWVRERVADRGKRPTVIVAEIMGKEIRVYGGRTLAADIVRTLDGDLLAANMTSLSLEQLIELDPDCLFLIAPESQFGNDQMLLNRIYHQPALRGLKCVRGRRVYPVPLYAVYTSAVRSYDGIRIIARGLYPELYKE